MRISHAHKFVFLATPRTGSTTVRKILDEYSDIKSVHISEITDEFQFYHHISALELKNIFEIRGWDWNNYKRFCVVRNPYDRVVSLYHHYLSKRDNPSYRKGLIKKLYHKITLAPSFRDYVLRINPKNRLQTSIKSFVCNENRDFLVEDILMFEKLNIQLPNYLEKIGIHITIKDIPHLNTSENRGTYREYYDNETRKRVSELYNYEIKEFGYSF